MSSSATYYGIPLLIGSVGAYFVGVMFEEEVPKPADTSAGLFGTPETAEAPSTGLFGSTTPEPSGLFGEPTGAQPLAEVSPQTQISPYLPTSAQASPYAPVSQAPKLEQQATTAPQTSFNISPQIQFPSLFPDQRVSSPLESRPTGELLAPGREIPPSSTPYSAVFPSVPSTPPVPPPGPSVPSTLPSVPSIPPLPPATPSVPSIPPLPPATPSVPSPTPSIPPAEPIPAPPTISIEPPRPTPPPASIPGPSVPPTATATSETPFGPIDRTGCVSSVGGPTRERRASASISTPQHRESTSVPPPASVPGFVPEIQQPSPPVEPTLPTPPVTSPILSATSASVPPFGAINREGCVSSVKEGGPEVQQQPTPAVIEPTPASSRPTAPQTPTQEETPFKGHTLDSEVIALPRVPDDVVVGSRRRRFKTARRSYF